MSAVTLISINNELYKFENVEDSLFDEIELEAITYVPQVSLDEDQIFCLTEFSQTEFCSDLLKQESFNTSDYNVFNNSMQGERSFLVNVVSGKYYFQKITDSLLKPSKRIILGESETKYEKLEQNKSISVKLFPDAIYDKNSDTLYFKKLENLKKIFLHIEELYIEATDDEVATFLDLDIIDCDNFSKDNVKSLNRKRIAMLKNKYDSYSDVEKQELKAYIHQYSPDLSFEDEKFKVSSDQDLKKLIYGIEQKYFTTEIDKERYVANSRIAIGGN
ncbi:hypothetical protein FIB49_04605 [Lactococcus cremoris]|uniref:Uncharacterized protein n=1 Tax=Lactococcus lactis subsp. cremoris TaxID=1359 RepID=A0AA34TGQ3_LACLC|nr:hypothetical protein [Lactococcus cremoris]ARE22328.1 hypothetical protein LLJM3_0105 [Lactococcus cremoris]MCT4421269.1 hypothetical protein [Lactococcus cremoris]MCT4426755.1 hypothetical protein [Lactococcus cremoris]MDM7653238.1 hypothetical protein [Lactococcus cremoris]TNU87510.1 hypothetical protein FIB49_04605 [Lactococcus cremoris]